MAKKSTNKEIDERITLVGGMISQGWTKTMIHQACATKWRVCWQTADRYVRSAREMFTKIASNPVRESVGRAIMFYESIIRDPSADNRDKIRAQERIDLLTGAEAASPAQAQTHNVNVKLSPAHAIERVAEMIGVRPVHHD